VQLGLWLLGRPFLALWVGPEYVDTSYPTLAILAAPLAFAMTQSISARFLYGLGRLKWYARFMLAEAASNLLLSMLLVRSLGIEGVALGTVIPNVLANFAVMVMICRTLQIPMASYLRSVFVVPLSCAALLAVGWWFATALAMPATWTAFVLTGALGVAGYAVLALAIEFGPRALLKWAHLRPGGQPAQSEEARVLSTRVSPLTVSPSLALRAGEEPARHRPACGSSERSPGTASESTPAAVTTDPA
jgi:Polysaccharide biosynthesis C-terminal domain